MKTLIIANIILLVVLFAVATVAFIDLLRAEKKLNELNARLERLMHKTKGDK